MQNSQDLVAEQGIQIYCDFSGLAASPPVIRACRWVIIPDALEFVIGDVTRKYTSTRADSKVEKTTAAAR
jgi:hypothetical protein